MSRPLLTLAALAAFALPARAQSIPVGPGSELSSLVGQGLDVPFVVDMTARAELLGAFAMRFVWDPAVLRFDGGFPGSFGSVTVNTDSLAEGVVRLAGANPSGSGGRVTVAVVRFTPLLAQATTVQVQVLELFAAGSFTDLLPAVTASDGEFCPARGRFGDVDRDGDANSRDGLIALSNAVGLDVSAFDIGLGDVDASGSTNARDALIILSAAVGLDVTGYRVLALAGGACVAGQPLTLAIVPGTIGEVVTGQTIRFEARAISAGGVPEALTDVRWLVSDPAVLGILPTGLAVAREPGTSEVIAVRDGGDTARVTVQVVARRTTHVVSPTAIGAVNRLGTPVLPFAALDEGEQVLVQGDTIRLRPGRYPGGASLERGAVIIGERAGPDGVVISGRAEPVGLSVAGAGVIEVHDVTIEGFLTGLEIGDADTVLLDSLRVVANGGGYSCFTAGVRATSVWLLRARWTRIVGDGTGGCADGVRIWGPVRTAVIEDAVLTDFGGTGIVAEDVDSLVVRRTLVSDVGSSGVETYVSYGGGGDAPPARGPGLQRGPTSPPASVAVIVEDSRIVRPHYAGLGLWDLRSALVARTVLEVPQADGIDTYGANAAGYLRLVRDSIITDDYRWMYAADLDSVVIDSTRVAGAYEGSFYNVDLVRVTTSSFHGITYGSAFYLSGYDSARAQFDSVSISGSSVCDQCIEAVYGYGIGGTFNRLRVENADDGIYLGDGAVTVTNSAFSDTWQGIYLYGDYDAPRAMTVRGVTLTDVYHGIEIDDAVAVIESVTTVRSWYPIETYGNWPDTIRLNTLNGGYAAIRVSGAPAVVAGNVITSVQDEGIDIDGYVAGAVDSAVIVNNEVTCAPGSYAWAGIMVRDLHARVQGNTVSGGCEYGIRLDANSAPLGGLVRGNGVTLDPATVHTGIRVDARWRARVVANTITGGRDEGTIRVGGSSDASRAPWVLVDSNTVQNAVAWGIRAAWLDTLEVRGNLVEDVTSPCCFSPNLGAIAVSQVRARARVAGNTIRRSAAPGVAVEQQEYYWYPLDTATVFVDSNAVSVTDSVAVRVGTAVLSMRHNNVRNNARDGVRFDGSAGAHVLRDNAFKGNGRYAVINPIEASVSADSNWWGVDGQMPRQPGDTAIAGVDSVDGVFDSAPLAAEPTGLPPLAPPAFRPSALALAPLLSEAAPSAFRSDGARPAARPERPGRAQRQPRAAAGARGEAPAARRPARAARLQETAVHRQAADAARAARDSTRAARRAALEREREERR